MPCKESWALKRDFNKRLFGERKECVGIFATKKVIKENGRQIGFLGFIFVQGVDYEIFCFTGDLFF